MDLNFRQVACFISNFFFDTTICSRNRSIVILHSIMPHTGNIPGTIYANVLALLCHRYKVKEMDSLFIYTSAVLRRVIRLLLCKWSVSRPLRGRNYLASLGLWQKVILHPADLISDLSIQSPPMQPYKVPLGYHDF